MARRLEQVLKALITNRSFKCKEEWLDQEEYKVYEQLRKQSLARRTKEVVDGVTWCVYKCTTKAEKLYQKIKK